MTGSCEYTFEELTQKLTELKADIDKNSKLFLENQSRQFSLALLDDNDISDEQKLEKEKLTAEEKKLKATEKFLNACYSSYDGMMARWYGNLSTAVKPTTAEAENQEDAASESAAESSKGEETSDNEICYGISNGIVVEYKSKSDALAKGYAFIPPKVKTDENYEIPSTLPKYAGEHEKSPSDFWAQLEAALTDSNCPEDKYFECLLQTMVCGADKKAVRDLIDASSDVTELFPARWVLVRQLFLQFESNNMLSLDRKFSLVTLRRKPSQSISEFNEIFEICFQKAHESDFTLVQLLYIQSLNSESLVSPLMSLLGEKEDVTLKELFDAAIQFQDKVDDDVVMMNDDDDQQHQEPSPSSKSLVVHNSANNGTDSAIASENDKSNAPELNSVYLGALPAHLSSNEVEKLFNIKGLECRKVDLKHGRGYGFIELATDEDAQLAVEKLDGYIYNGSKIIVEIARPKRPVIQVPVYKKPRLSLHGNDKDSQPPKPRSPWRVSIKNLPTGLNWRDLKDFLRQVAPVSFCDISKDRPSDGVALFDTHDDMFKTIKALSGQTLKGNHIYLVPDVNHQLLNPNKRPRLSSPSGR